MKNNWIKIAGWSVVLALIIISLAFVAKQEAETPLKNIDVKIENNLNHFVSKREIKQLILKKDSLGKPLKNYQINRLEKVIENHPSVAAADVYKTISGNIYVTLTQRQPIIRVITPSESYYIDQDGLLMPLSQRYTARVPIVSLNKSEPYSRYFKYNFSEQLPDSVANKTLLDDIFRISAFIQKDAFLKAQIEQMFVDKQSDWVLIPKVGNHTIVVGSAKDLQSKFKKLKLFYKKGLKNVGWDKYKSINLKYKNQVVCTKK